MRVYADDIDKLRIPMPASSNWGDPKGRVDPEVLRAASWGTDYDVEGRRNSIAQTLTQQQQQQTAAGGGLTPAQQYLQAIGWGGTEQQYYDSLGGNEAATALYRNAGGGGSLLGAVAPAPVAQPIGGASGGGFGMFGSTVQQLPSSAYVESILAANPGLREQLGSQQSNDAYYNAVSGGASGSAAGIGASGGDTG